MSKKTSIFVDLDGLLIRTYSKEDVEMYGEKLPKIVSEVRGIFGGLFIKKRPHVEQFLEIARSCGDVFLFTASKLSYAKSALKAFELDGYFKKFYTSQLVGIGSVAYDLKLHGGSWILIDDSPVTHDTVRYKLGSLGMSEENLENQILIDRHFFQIKSYQPHLNGEDSDLMDACEIIKERVKVIEKRMILH